MIERKTIFSADRKFRYTLWRGEENPTAKFVLFIGLNPSTADEKINDQTIRRCIDFAKRWGYSALCMTNLFAYRATLPANMKKFSSPVGVDNQHHLVQCASHADLVVAAWGQHGKYQHQDQTTRQWLIEKKIYHLGLNGDGTPKHPLRLIKTTIPTLWPSDIKCSFKKRVANFMTNPSQSGIVLFLGMVRRGEFENLQKHGLKLGILVDTNSKTRLGDVSQFVVVERFDFSRPLPELIAAVREIQKRFSIACLFNVIEFYVAQTAEVAAELGLPGISSASAGLCLDKNLMRQRFHDRIGPQSVAKFHDIHSEAELLKFANELGYPCFLQPSNVSASMWATRNTDAEKLLTNYRAMLDEVPKYYERLGKKSARLSVVLAEYMEGSNISIDCLMDHSGRVYTTPAVEVLTGKDVGIDDFHHFARLLPPRLSEEEKAKLNQLAIAGVKALDMTTSAAHVEFIGARLGEIAARPGGNRPRILELAYGMDMLYAYYQILRGEIPDLKRDRNLAAAVVTPFAPRNGILRSLRHLAEIPKLPGYLYHEVRGQIGQPIGLSKTGHRAGLYIELVSADAEVVRDSVNQIASWSDLYELE